MVKIDLEIEPLSKRTKKSGVNLAAILVSPTINLSVHKPPYDGYTYEIEPDLVQKISFFKVFRLLYTLYD